MNRVQSRAGEEAGSRGRGEHQRRGRVDPPRRRWRAGRLFLRLLAVLVAVVAAVLISVFTVDLGPSLRERAEREGSKYMERPMHIGRLSARLTPGVFVVEDLVIEGLTPVGSSVPEGEDDHGQAAVVVDHHGAS